eukprot:441379_1
MMSDISDKLEEKELHSAGVNVPIDEMAPNDSLISTGGIQDSLVQLRELCAKLKGAGLDVYNVCFSNGQIDDTPHEFPEGERALYWVGNRKFSDCFLKYSEEVDPIPAHRIYLTRRSEFFRAMFGVNRAGKWYEGAAEFPIVDLSLPDSQSFLVMLKYLYTGEIYVLKDDCANARGFCGVLANSEYLLVDGLSEELYKENRFGDNTCFMNVVIQALWHIRSFRERFYSLNYTHTHKRTPCVYCSLLHVFTHYKFAEDKIAPPRQLREALAKLSQRESYEYSFNLGALCDAEECLDAILKWFHCDQVGLKSLKRYKDTGCSPECISHVSFGAEICDIRICTEPKCRGSNEPLPIQSFIYRVFVMEVLSVTPPRRAKSPFAYQLFQAYRHQEYSCPVDGIKCPKGSARVERWCLKVPEVFTMSLIWPPIVKKHLLSKMLHALDLKINLRHFFSVHANQMSTSFELVGMILFEGMGHYVSIYFGERQNAWLLFDDTSVRVLGDFDAVIKKCLERMLRPTVLFFERDVIRSKIWDSSLQLAKTMESPLPAEEYMAQAKNAQMVAEAKDAKREKASKPLDKSDEKTPDSDEKTPDSDEQQSAYPQLASADHSEGKFTDHSDEKCPEGSQSPATDQSNDLIFDKCGEASPGDFEQFFDKSDEKYPGDHPPFESVASSKSVSEEHPPFESVASSKSVSEEHPPFESVASSKSVSEEHPPFESVASSKSVSEEHPPVESVASSKSVSEEHPPFVPV